jgi:ATP-dependent Lon protease
MRDRLADAGFSGTVPVFPLPDVVLFPDALLPLHVFEPRYRAMVAAARGGEGLIAVATLLPGWEKDYEGAPAFHPLATVGRIVRIHDREDGRSDLLLLGLERARLEEEFAAHPFRTARAAPVPDAALPADDPEFDEAVRRLLVAYEYELQLSQRSGGPLAASGGGITRETAIHTVCQNLQVPAFQRLRALEAAGPADRVPMARAWLGERLDLALAERGLPRLALVRGEEN